MFPLPATARVVSGSENIAHIEFYLQGLLPKIIATYTIKTVTSHSGGFAFRLTGHLQASRVSSLAEMPILWSVSAPA